MRKKTLIIISLFVVLFIFIWIYFFTRNKYVGTWNNITISNDLRIVKTITIKRNGKITFTISESKKAEKYIREGTWKKEEDHIVILFNGAKEAEKEPVYLIDKSTVCYEIEKCEEYQKFYKKTLFSKEKEYIYETEKQDTTTQKDPQWENITTDKDDSDEKIDANLDIKKDGKVIIHFFRGQGCSHSAEAQEWFESIKGEYGYLFTVVDYETWYNQDNAKLMEAVAKSRGEDVSGVPYIIIGDKSWNGFAESYEQEIINELKSIYNG